METLKCFTVKESIAHRLQFLIDLPAILDTQKLKALRENILITPDCFNAALLSLSRYESSALELKKFSEKLTTFFWKHRFPETSSEYAKVFLSNEWREIRNNAKRIIFLFKN